MFLVQLAKVHNKRLMSELRSVASFLWRENTIKKEATTLRRHSRALELHMNKYIINCEGFTTEDDFWDAYVSCVEIVGANSFGRNIDALWDALHAGGPGTPKDRSCFISVRKTDSIKKLRNGNFYDHLRQIAYDLSADPVSTMKFRVN